jgi:phospholipid/cholesterol/gamma-HCH transport system substrate-binding protein
MHGPGAGRGRGSWREILVGLVVVLTLVGLLALFGLAGGGPGFLTARRTIDVVFRDGQGIRVGSPVRVAGLDAGRVVDINLTEIEGTLWARVRIALPTALAGKLRQDVKVTIQASLAGQSRVNIVSTGRSSVALVSGQVVHGVESTFFDPVLEQVGLGPVERSHLSHTIAEVRQTVDAVGPRVRQILATLQDTAVGLRESADTIRPAVESTAGHVEELARRVNASTPRIEAAITRIDTLTHQADSLLAENRPNLQATLASSRDLIATVNDIVAKDRPKVERAIDNLEGTRARADRVLYQLDQISDQTLQIVGKNRANLERTMANVRDATDWGDKLVQKIYANPFFLSPFYRPTPEDVRVQAAYDTAQVFVKGMQELDDLVKTLDAMQAKAATPERQQELLQVEQSIRAATARLDQTARLLAESLKSQPQAPKVRR